MADDKNMIDDVDSMLNDVFSDSSNNSFSDDNSDLFSLLGMSEDEIQAASDNLAKEDAEWKNKNAKAAPSSSKERAKKEASDYIKRANENKNPVTEEYTTAEVATTENEQSMNSEQDSVSEKMDAATKKQLKLKQKQQKKEEKLAKKQAKKEAKLAKQQKKQAVKQIMEETEKQTLQETATDDTNSSFEVDSNINIDELFAEDSSTDAQNVDSVQDNSSVSMQTNDAISDNNAKDVAVSDKKDEKASIGSKASALFFGVEEEDECPSAEEIARKEEKKKRKEEKKEAKRQKQAQKKEQHALDKSKAKEMAVVKKAAKKDKLEKIRQEEEEEDAKEKRIKGSSVFMVGAVLTALGLVVIGGTAVFDYKMVMTRATKYFQNQKYKLAYEQIAGVEVKEQDKPLKDKIYCVMYVQQQLDSYYNFCKLDMYENGLDSLIKGLKKYDLHYEEAVSLGVTAELDSLRVQIETELQNQFGISAETASAWSQLDQSIYSQTIREHVTSLQLNTKQDASVVEKDVTMNDTSNE